MKKLTGLMTAGILSTLIVSASFAGPDKGCHRGGGYHGGGKDRLIQQLDLSEEQKTAIAELRKAQREQITTQRQSKVFLTASPDQADYQEQVQAYAKERAAAVEEKILAKSKMRAEIFALLTPEQQAQLVELKQEKQAQRLERRAAREERFNNRLDSDY